MPGRNNPKADYNKLSGKNMKKESPKVAISSDEAETETCHSCKVLKGMVDTLLKKQESLEQTVRELKDEQKEMKEELGRKDDAHEDGLSVGELAEMKKQVNDLQERVEERTNRQLRQTLVWRNLPEGREEKTWADTKTLLASKMSELLNIDPSEAKSKINRCHRGGNAEYYRNEGRCRPIYAAMLTWDSCEDLVKAARGQNDFYIDYKYGPMTTQRRNLALKKRKELKSAGVITSGFIKFPAILMGRKSDTDKYYEVENFSKAEVSFKKDRK